jgi:hypothetical protein
LEHILRFDGGPKARGAYRKEGQVEAK